MKRERGGKGQEEREGERERGCPVACCKYTEPLVWNSCVYPCFTHTKCQLASW